MARTVLSVATFAVVALGLHTVGFSAQAATRSTETARTEASPALDTDVYEARVHRQINKKREARGLRKLRFEACTDQVAERWGRHLAETLSFAHQSMTTVLETCDAAYAGETLAKGSVSPRAMVRLWMDSPGHRAILLSKSPRRIGIGAYPDSTGVWVVAANFTRF